MQRVTLVTHLLHILVFGSRKKTLQAAGHFGFAVVYPSLSLIYIMFSPGKDRSKAWSCKGL